MAAPRISSEEYRKQYDQGKEYRSSGRPEKVAEKPAIKGNVVETKAEVPTPKVETEPAKKSATVPAKKTAKK